MTARTDDVEILRDPDSMCASNFDEKSWAGTIPLRIGRYGVGLRVDTPETEAAFRAVLAPHVDDSLEVNPIYNVRGPEKLGFGETFTILYRGFQPVARARGWGRAVDALLGHLSDLRRPLARGRMRIAGVAFITAGGAVVAPPRILNAYRLFERRLEVLGSRVVDRPWVTLDVTAGTVVVDPADLPFDAGAYEALVGHPPTPPDASAPAPAPARRWVVEADEGSRGRAVHHVATTVLAWPPGDPGAGLAALERLVTDVRWVSPVTRRDRWLEALTLPS